MKNILILLFFPAFLTAQPVYTYWHGYADVTVTATYGNDSIVVAVDEGTFAGGAFQTGNHTLASFPFSSLSGGGLKAWFVCNLFQITRYNPVTQRVTLLNLDKPNQLVPSGVFRVFMLEETENTLGDVVGMFPIFADGNGSGAMTGINPFEAACIINHYSLRAAGGSIAKDATLDGVGSVYEPLKIAQQGASPGDVLTWDGSTWVPDVVSGAGIPNGEYYDIEWSNTPLELFIRDSRINSGHILDGSIEAEDIGTAVINTTHIGNGQVQADDIDTDAVGSAEIAANAVGSSEIAADAVGASEIAANAVGTTEIADAAVTMQKIAQSGATTGQVLEWNGTAWAPATDDTGGGGGAVSSVFGRTGTVVAASDDYTASQVTNTPAGNIAATTVQAALNELDTEKLATGAAAGGDLSGTLANLQIEAGAVGSTEIGDDAVGADEIAAGAVGPDELASTAVTPGAYTNANVTIDADGRVTSASNGSGSSPAGSTGQVQYNNAGAFGAESNLFWDATNDRLGIGTNSPQYPFHISTSGLTRFGVQYSTTSYGGIEFRTSGNEYWGFYVGGPSYTSGYANIFGIWQWRNAAGSTVNKYRLFVANSGNVGIGADTESAVTSKLTVDGDNGHTQFRMTDTYTPSATADGNGATGQVAWDDSYIYIKTSAGWKRAALSTF